MVSGNCSERINLINKWESLRVLQNTIENIRDSTDFATSQSKINICHRDLDFWKLTAPELDQSCQNAGIDFSLNDHKITFEGFVSNLLGNLATVKSEIESHQKKSEETSKLNSKLDSLRDDVALWKEKVGKVLNKTKTGSVNDFQTLLKELKVISRFASS